MNILDLALRETTRTGLQTITENTPERPRQYDKGHREIQAETKQRTKNNEITRVVLRF